MLHCKIKLMSKQGKEILPGASRYLTKRYQEGEKLPRNGSKINKYRIIERRSDNNTIYFLLEQP